MKKLYLQKQSHCLFYFIIAVLLCLSGAAPLAAAVTKDFSESNFWVVDHTTMEYTTLGNVQYNPKGIIGYKPNPDNNNPNEYQLTDTVSNMTVAMWNKHKIDMNQNWEFDFQLFFDTGRVEYNSSILIGSRDRKIADGMVFALHTLDTMTTKSMIGNITWFIGYGGYRGVGGVSPSFAIEFDTEFVNSHPATSVFDEGGYKIGSSHHIAYLKDGNMAALPGTYQPMQNNWANVGWGKWFNVKIVWRKVCANDTTYYDLLTYMEERDTTSLENHGPLVLRDSMRFNKLSEVIAGLTVDSNGQALVTWGVTSATCWIPNHQRIRYTRLTTADVFAPTVTAVIAGRCEDGQYTTGRGVGVSSLKRRNIDTILRPTNCYAINSQTLKSDTIEYTISCEEFLCNNEYAFGFHDVPHGAICKYYLNNELIDSTIYDTTGSHNTWHRPLYREYFRNDSAANIKIIIDSVEYNFRIFSNDKTTDWADELSQEIDIQWDKGMRVGTIEVDSSSLLQSIQLPELAECSYELNPGSSDFATPPSVDSNGVLTFELNPDVCSANLYIELSCECDKTFYFEVKNASYPTGCAAVTFTEVSRQTSRGLPASLYPSMWDNVQLCCNASQLYIGYTATTTSPCANISTTIANEIESSHDEVAVELINLPANSIADTVRNFYIKLSGDVKDTIYKRYEVCTYIEGGVMCCDTFEFNGYFNGKGMGDFRATVEMSTLRAEVNLSDLVDLPTPPIWPGAGGNVATIADLPIKITLHNFYGAQIAVLVDETMMDTSKVVYYNIHSLDPGYYNVMFQLGGDGGYVETIGIIR